MGYHIETEAEREVALYNAQRYASWPAGEAQEVARSFTLKLMIGHLYHEHNLTARKIAQRLGMKEKVVKTILVKQGDMDKNKYEDE